jgi:TetR/AcrR family transcriptional regulator, cholesterol catabolism regulator
MDAKERILNKANELYMRYGVRSVTMDDIAEQSGVSKKTIYQFFADKDELVDAVLKAEVNQSEEQCLHSKTTAVNAIDEVFKAMEQLEEMFRTMNPTLVFDLHKYYPKAYQHMERHKSEFVYHIIKDNLKRGIEEGLYRPDIKIAIMSKFRVESMMLPFDPEFQAKARYNIADLENEILLHFLYGIASPKGYKLIQKYQQQRLKNLNTDEKRLVK